MWIVDLPGLAVEVYRTPDGDAYRDRDRPAAGRLAPARAPDLAIDVAALLA
ncbi:hypothetical protein [Roseiarcus fermentans]|uniref:hypothetical protein n=1 Tax=Roseiarcus fermentans TaxID=1473586 RepID=UPI001FE1D88D